jgi:hypothetical protein
VQGVRVDDHRDPGTDAARHRVERLAFQQRHLTGEPDQRLSGLGGLGRLRPPDQDLADRLLERLDPLAHRGRRHVQRPGRRLEAALLDHRLEGRELDRVHKSS